MECVFGSIKVLIMFDNSQYPQIKTSLEELSNTAQVDALLKDKPDIGFYAACTGPGRAVLSVVWKEDHRSRALNHCISLLLAGQAS